MAPRARLAAATLMLAAACGRSAPDGLAPHDMSKGLDLAWRVGRVGPDGEFMPTHVWRLEMLPAGRFRYAGRAVEGTGNTWSAIEGTWSSDPDDASSWLLKPENGREGLKPGAFTYGAWPRLHWLTGGRAGSGGGALAPSYRIPWFDLESHRLEASFTYCGDPRVPENKALRQATEQLLEANE